MVHEQKYYLGGTRVPQSKTFQSTRVPGAPNSRLSPKYSSLLVLSRRLLLWYVGLWRDISYFSKAIKNKTKFQSASRFLFYWDLVFSPVFQVTHYTHVSIRYSLQPQRNMCFQQLIFKYVPVAGLVNTLVNTKLLHRDRSFYMP